MGNAVENLDGGVVRCSGKPHPPHPPKAVAPTPAALGKPPRRIPRPALERYALVSVRS